jgi:hypothetical protein
MNQPEPEATSKSVRERLLGGRKSKPVSEIDNQKLLHAQMQFEYDRLAHTSTALDLSSATISSIFAANQDFRSRLARASEALRLLRRRMERDTRFVLAAFWFMVFVAVFVISRRIGLVWAFKRGFNFTTWLGTYAWDLMRVSENEKLVNKDFQEL